MGQRSSYTLQLVLLQPLYYLATMLQWSRNSHFRETSSWRSSTSMYILGMGHYTWVIQARTQESYHFLPTASQGGQRLQKISRPSFSPALFPFRKRQFSVKLSKCTLTQCISFYVNFTLKSCINTTLINNMHAKVFRRSVMMSITLKCILK